LRRVLILPAATEDLDLIFINTAQKWSIEQAERYLDLLEDSFAELARRPSSGKSCDDLRPGMRREVVKSHVVYFLCSREELSVVRVLHKKVLPELHTF
jgi:toxin ParE1/3/4